MDSFQQPRYTKLKRLQMLQAFGFAQQQAGEEKQKLQEKTAESAQQNNELYLFALFMELICEQ